MEHRPAHSMNFDYSQKPFLVIWETTHACDLLCIHCRAEAVSQPDPNELKTAEAIEMLKDIRSMGTPIIVFSGGDPLKRKDLAILIREAKSLGFRTGAIPAVTPALTREKMIELKESGLDQIAFSLDAPTAVEHDSFRRVPGVFKQTLEVLKIAGELGLAVQINSLINIHNTKDLDELICLVEAQNIVFWEVFFLVPMGRGKEMPLIAPQKFDEAFEKIHQASKRVPFLIKVTEAPHYRAYVARKEGTLRREMPVALRRTEGPGGSIGMAPQGVNAGKGFAFVSYLGDVYPSGFLPVKTGNVRQTPLSELYKNSPIFRQLRDTSLLKGKCGRCEHKDFCGGSRARAYAMTGDYLAEDICCSYEPPVKGLDPQI